MRVRFVNGVFLLLVASRAQVACSSQQTSQDAGNPLDSSGESSALVPGCSVVPPILGASCADEGRECEYGTSSQASCNTIATCTAGRWSEVVGATCKSPVNDVSCPSTF